MRLRKTAALMAATGAAAFLLPQIQAGTFNANFNDNAVPAGTYLNGVNGGGVIDSGVLKVTSTGEDQYGGFVIEDLDAGAPVYGFNFTGKVRVDSGGTPADGFSLNFAPDIAETTGGGNGEFEDGVGSGIRIAFDTYNNPGEVPPSPSISLRIGGTVITNSVRSAANIMTGPTFADISLVVSPSGAVTLTYKGETIFNNVYFAGYEPISNGRFAIAGRTGGANENVWFDELSLTTVTTGAPALLAGPTSQTIRSGSSVTFSPVMNNPQTATFQWLKNGAPITGATQESLTLNSVGLTDSGAKYSVRVTGAGLDTTSTEATLTVIDILLPAPAATYDFNTTTLPAGTTLLGTIPAEGEPTYAGYITETGGVNDSGVLHLTDAQNGQRAVFFVEDLSAGAPVYGLAANFKLRMGGGSDVPADGLSFNFGSDIVDTIDGDLEEGLGTGLTVTFDIFDNAGGEAPSIDVKYGGTTVAQQKVPSSLFDTEAEFVDVVIRLENDGTIDVVFDGIVVHNNVTIPGFTSITGGRYALAARTGGLNQNIWVDDFTLTPNTTAGDLRIVTQPRSQYVITSQTVNLTGAASAEGVTYQWLRNGDPITGANSADYSFSATTADNNALYTLRATQGALTATSNPATLTVLTINPTVSFDFNTGTTAPVGTTLNGNAPEGGAAGVIVETGGVNDSGVLHLTEAANSQWGAFVVEPLLGGAEVAAINVAFDLLLRSFGTPADGISFNWAPNLPATVAGFEAEEGTGQGLTVTFDTYENTPPGEAPAIDLKWKGVTFASTKLTRPELLTGDSFRKVIIKVTPDGKLDLVYGDRVVYSGIQIPGFAPITNGKYAFYGRTGGANEDAFIDNVLIEAIKSTAPLRIITEPSDALVLSGQTATFTVGVSDPVGVTYQWFRNGAPITGATSATYTTPALTSTDNNVAFTVTATGPGGSPTSRQAIVRVVQPLTIGANPEIAFNFDDGATPEGTTLIPGRSGGAYITIDGGVNNSGVLHLTDDLGDQGAGFFIPAPADPINAFTANFKIRVAAAGAPADGVSFSWSDTIQPTGTVGEAGTGSDLVISIDTWQNEPPGEAPAFDIFWQGAEVATLKVPVSQILTGDNFGDVFIRVESDGTVDFQYNGRAIFSNVQLPNFEAIANSSFAIGGRTGGASALQWIDDLKIDVTTGATAPSVSIARNQDGTLRIEWAGGGTLESAPTVLGPWNPVTGASSPATVTTSGQMQFFRVAQPAP